jgi:mannosyltransferase
MDQPPVLVDGDTTVLRIPVRGTQSLRLGRHELLLAAVFVLALAVRLFHITYNSLWLDEGFSVWLASKDPSSIVVTAVSSEDEPLYYIALHHWIRLVGRSELALRLFSAICGVLTVGAAYALGRVLAGSRVGLLMAFLQAISPLDVWYAQEVGRFALGGLFGLTSSVCLAAGLLRRRLVFWLGYVAASLAALYTLYVALGLVLLQGMTVLVVSLYSRPRPRLDSRWLPALGLIGLGFWPWLPAFRTQMSHVGGVSLFYTISQWLRLLGIDIHITVLPAGVLVVLMLTLIALGLLLGNPVIRLVGSLYRRSPGWLLAAVMPGYLAMLAVAGLRPISSVRLGLVFVPYLLLVLAILLVAAKPAVWLLPGLVSLTVLTLAANAFVTHKEDWRSVATILDTEAQPGEAILLSPGFIDFPLLYYYQGQLPRIGVGVQGNEDVKLTEIVRRHPRLWLATGLYYTRDVAPGATVSAWLTQRCRLMQSFDFSHVSLERLDCGG